MSYMVIFMGVLIGLMMFVVGSIGQIQSDLKRISKKVNKIAEKVGVEDNIIEELKSLISDGKKIEAIKQYRIETGVSLKAAKEYIDLLSK